MPIGQASGIGWDADGSALWSLTIHGARVPGRWVIIDRRFVPLDDDPAAGRSGWREAHSASRIAVPTTAMIPA
jgi:hypothetical protein